MSHMTHTAPLLPGWLRAAWIVALCAVAIVHLRHIWVMRGQRRYWHVGHALMATGMAYMYLHHSAHSLPNPGGAAVFVVAATASIAAAMAFRLRDGIFNPLWIFAAVEMAAMVYMFLPANTRSTLLSVVLAAYLAAIGLLWALGKWDGHYHATQPHASDEHSASPVRLAAAADPPRQANMWLRASLATMTAGMAYMLLVT